METKPKKSAESFVKDIRRKSRRVFSSEQKILIVMEALRGEGTVAEICRCKLPLKPQHVKIERCYI
jgi:transposase